jgi:MYXO-CTERM domain-containing protein
MSTALRATVVALLGLAMNTREAGAADRTFQPGSLIIPMDLSYQSTGMFQAYGLIYQLLGQGVHVHWVIDPNKTYHAAACNTPGDLCAWDCAIEGSGAKCPYPTASPDVTVTASIVWDDRGVAARGSTLGTHRYRGGPFVIDAADHDKALAIIDAWNDKAMWAANPWATRSVFHAVSVHEATAAFTGTVAKEMLAAPSIAVFADGNEPIATGYLRAAGIPQSSGAEFPAAKCGTSDCGPGTGNPDMLTEEAIAGDLGTCAAPNYDHHNGALFKPTGEPAYCQIMSMHWDVTDRETVKCDGGACPTTQAECTNQKFTFNGHEVVAEVREFLKSNVHFFAECQAVNAYENTTPNPAWPFLDDEGRDGHFLTTRGTPPACPCSDADYQCVTGGCNGTDCCMAKDIRERNAGYEIAPQPASNTVKVLRPDLPYSQFDGMFGTTGGSEPSYNLSSYLGTTYKNNRQVTLITGPDGPGNQDLWMTGYLDGCDDIIFLGPSGPRAAAAAACGGKISYLGGHQYSTAVPVTSGAESQGTRLFLNALFEAQCVNGEGAGGGGGSDTDGDGVPDATDPFPDDPNRCGDSNQDGCDDCVGGHLDLAGNCGEEPGQSGGCCETGAASPASPLALTGLVVLLARRTRRRRPRCQG